MTNFEPKKLPPLGPPGRKTVPAKPSVSKPPVAPPTPPNLPPKPGSIKPPAPPVSKPAAPAQASPFPPAYNQQPQQYQPEQQQQQYQQPYNGQQSYQEPQQNQQPQQATWEERYSSQQQQQGQQFPQQNQQQYNDQQGNAPYGDQQQNSGWGRQQQQPAPISRTERDEDEYDDEEEAPRKSKKASKKQVATKKKKVAAKKAKEKKPNEYAGSRSKLLMTRILLFGTVGILVAAGVYSFIPKASYLTQADQNTMINKVRENLGETYFPTEAGEGWARGFLDVYLNYTPEIAERRTEQLLTYTTADVLKGIDITFLTETEIDLLANKEKATIEDLEAIAGITDTKTQIVTAGPYLIKKELLPGDSIGIFSYKVQINGNNWAYIEVPIYYNMEERGLSVSGTPTFRSVIPISKPPVSNLEKSFENDRDVSGKIEKDIKAYLQSWVSSDQTGIDRYLVKEKGDNAVTPQASTGLGGSVDFLSLDKLTVQSKVLPKEEELTAEAKNDYNTRYVIANIRVVEPTSGIVYRQNYQLVIKYVNENWFVQDIRNMVVFADN